jgi:hypothetical protein
MAAALLAWAASIRIAADGRITRSRRPAASVRLAPLRPGVFARDRPPAPKQSAKRGNYGQIRHDRPDQRIRAIGRLS